MSADNHRIAPASATSCSSCASRVITRTSMPCTWHQQRALANALGCWASGGHPGVLSRMNRDCGEAWLAWVCSTGLRSSVCSDRARTSVYRVQDRTEARGPSQSQTGPQMGATPTTGTWPLSRASTPAIKQGPNNWPLFDGLRT